MATQAATSECDTLTPYRALTQTLVTHFGERLKMIVLFGSRSRGDARSDSDHDLFLVIEGLPREPLARQRTIMAPLLPSLHLMPERLAMIARTPEEVRSHLTSLVADVCVDGQSLYGEAAFAELRTRVLQAVQEIGLARQRVAGTWMWRFPTFSNQEWAVTWGDKLALGLIYATEC